MLFLRLLLLTSMLVQAVQFEKCEVKFKQDKQSEWDIGADMAKSAGMIAVGTAIAAGYGPVAGGTFTFCEGLGLFGETDAQKAERDRNLIKEKVEGLSRCVDGNFQKVSQEFDNVYRKIHNLENKLDAEIAELRRYVDNRFDERDMENFKKNAKTFIANANLFSAFAKTHNILKVCTLPFGQNQGENCRLIEFMKHGNHYNELNRVIFNLGKLIIEYTRLANNQLFQGTSTHGLPKLISEAMSWATLEAYVMTMETINVAQMKGLFLITTKPGTHHDKTDGYSWMQELLNRWTDVRNNMVCYTQAGPGSFSRMLGPGTRHNCQSAQYNNKHLFVASNLVSDSQNAVYKIMLAISSLHARQHDPMQNWNNQELIPLPQGDGLQGGYYYYPCTLFAQSKVYPPYKELPDSVFRQIGYVGCSEDQDALIQAAWSQTMGHLYRSAEAVGSSMVDVMNNSMYMKYLGVFIFVGVFALLFKQSMKKRPESAYILEDFANVEL